MADEEQKQEGEEQAPAEGAAPEAPAKKSFPILHIALGLQVLVILGAMGVLVKYALFTSRVKITKQILGERAIASLRDKVEKIKILDVDEMAVNLENKRTLLAHIQLEVSNPEVESELKKRMPALQSKLLNILGSQSTDFTESLQGKLIIQEKIRTSFNEELEKKFQSSDQYQRMKTMMLSKGDKIRDLRLNFVIYLFRVVSN